MVYFANNAELRKRINDGPRATTLTAWFDVNARNHILADGTPARSLLYADFPRYFTWEASNRAWSEREDGYAIGRMHSVHPGDHERFYLRLLLNRVRGATSYEDLRTIKCDDGQKITYDSFRDTALALGLLIDDNCWHKTMKEAAASRTGAQLRRLFVSLLLFGEVHEPGKLFEEFVAVSYTFVPALPNAAACRI